MGWQSAVGSSRVGKKPSASSGHGLKITEVAPINPGANAGLRKAAWLSMGHVERLSELVYSQTGKSIFPGGLRILMARLSHWELKP